MSLKFKLIKHSSEFSKKANGVEMHSLSMAASLTPLYTDITVTDPCEAEIAYTMLWLNPNI